MASGRTSAPVARVLTSRADTRNFAKVEFRAKIHYMARMQTASAAPPPVHGPIEPMPIPGHIDPVPVPRPAVARADGRIDLIGLAREQLRAVLADAGLEPKQAKLRAKQIWHWIYNRGATDFAAMTDIAKAQHPWLAERFVIGRPEVVEAQVSTDGTRKWLLRSADGQDYEMVFIPDADRGTLCVSSQVGCTLNCRIVPLNRKYGIEELLQACADYPGANNARRITFEYVMLKDKNDSDADARELVRLLKKYKLPAKVNLIPFNPWPGAPYECSAPERIRAFSNIVFEAGISAPVRTPRGRDIDAACGQLKTAAEKKSRAQMDREAEEKMAALG